jgi:hypothetical protein
MVTKNFTLSPLIKQHVATHFAFLFFTKLMLLLSAVHNTNMVADLCCICEASTIVLLNVDNCSWKRLIIQMIEWYAPLTPCLVCWFLTCYGIYLAQFLALLAG